MTRFDAKRWAWLIILTSGCATQKPAPAPPVLTLQTTRALGSPLASTLPAIRSVSSEDLIGIDIQWVAVPQSADEGLTPLDAVASLTSAPLGAGAVLPSGEATRSAKFAGGIAARNWFDLATAPAAKGAPAAVGADVGHQISWIAPGTNVRFVAQTPALPGGVTIAVYRLPVTASPQTPTTAASTEPSTAPTTTPSTAPTTAPVGLATFAISIASTGASPTDASGPETAYVERQPLAEGTPYLLVVPSRVAGPWKAIAAYITVKPASAADPAAIAAWHAGGATSTTVPTTQFVEQLNLRRALDALGTGGDPRSALIYLAAATNARIAGDAALVADATLLNKMRDAVKDTPATSPEVVSWALDRTTLLTLADAASKAPLAPEMVAALAVYTGEVGRHPDTLAEITNAVGSAADLQARLIGENFIALEDNAASARVRAFDWLKAQNKAPADYDPLGPVRARRAAINKAIAVPGATP